MSKVTSPAGPAAAERCATVSATHARCSAKGCEGSSHRRSSSTLRSSSCDPGTPGPGSDTSRTSPGFPGSRDAVATIGIVTSGTPSSFPPSDAPPYAVSTGTWSTAPLRSSENGGVSVHPPARLRRAGYSVRTAAIIPDLDTAAADGAGGRGASPGSSSPSTLMTVAKKAAFSAASAAGLPNSGATRAKGETTAARRHRRAAASAASAPGPPPGGERASATRPAARRSRLDGPGDSASSSLPLLAKPSRSTLDARLARAYECASLTSSSAFFVQVSAVSPPPVTNERSGGARSSQVSAAYSLRTICLTIGPSILRRSSSRRRFIAAWSARTLNASLTETRNPSSVTAACPGLDPPLTDLPPRRPGVPGGTPLTFARSSSAAVAASCDVDRTGKRRASVVVRASPSAQTAIGSSPSLPAASATGTPSKVLFPALLTSSLTSMTMHVQQCAPPEGPFASATTPAPAAAASFSGTQCMKTPGGTTTPGGRSTSWSRHPDPTVASACTSQCASSDPCPTLAPMATCDASMHAPGPEDRPDPQTPSAPMLRRLAPNPAVSIMPLSHVPTVTPACAAGYAASTFTSTAV